EAFEERKIEGQRYVAYIVIEVQEQPVTARRKSCWPTFIDHVWIGGVGRRRDVYIRDGAVSGIVVSNQTYHTVGMTIRNGHLCKFRSPRRIRSLSADEKTRAALVNKSDFIKLGSSAGAIVAGCSPGQAHTASALICN